MDSSPPATAPPEKRTFFGRGVDSILQDWRAANVPVRFYVVGLVLIGLAVPLIWVRASSVWIGAQLLAGAVVASSGFVLEVYRWLDWLWETKIGKLVGVLVGTMVGSFAMALASVIVNDATGIDPTHFPFTIAFIAPLTAGYVIAVIALLAVLGGVAVFIAKALVDIARTGLAHGRGKSFAVESPMQDGLRFIAVVVMSVLLAFTWQAGQRPYASFLGGTARWFSYALEMYGSDPCRLPNTRLRRLSDDVVLDGVPTGQRLVFRTRRCALEDSIP